jgi:hypothetical protein
MFKRTRIDGRSASQELLASFSCEWMIPGNFRAKRVTDACRSEQPGKEILLFFTCAWVLNRLVRFRQCCFLFRHLVSFRYCCRVGCTGTLARTDRAAASRAIKAAFWAAFSWGER